MSATMAGHQRKIRLHESEQGICPWDDTVTVGGHRRRVIVTGAAGLIGQAVVRRLLEQGDDVVAIARPGGDASFAAGVEIREIDLANLTPDALSLIGAFDAVIHLAQAPGWHDFPRNSGAIAAISLTATARLAEIACAVGAKSFVFASSGGIYGPSPAALFETAPVKPAAELGFYLATKAAAEQLLGYFSAHLTMHVLRPFFVYGHGQGPAFLIPRLIESVRSGTPINVNEGRGTRLNPLHVDDAAAAFAAALDLETSIVANIAGPDIVSIREIADIAAEALGKDAIFNTGSGQPDDFMADIHCMTRILGAPKIGIRAGIAGLLAGQKLQQKG